MSLYDLRWRLRNAPMNLKVAEQVYNASHLLRVGFVTKQAKLAGLELSKKTLENLADDLDTAACQVLQLRTQLELASNRPLTSLPKLFHNINDVIAGIHHQRIYHTGDAEELEQMEELESYWFPRKEPEVTPITNPPALLALPVAA